MTKEPDNIHSGHRERLKSRFRDHGLENFDDHNVLELLLFFSKPRGDTNPTAHELIKRFGSLADVFDAPLAELAKTPGVGDATALLIKLVPQVSRRYLISRTAPDKILDSSKKAGDYLLPYFFGERDECVYLVCLDAKCKVLSTRLIFRGSVNSAAVNVRKLVEAALSFNATSVILAHNHTSGIAIPSDDDKVTTRRIFDALAAVDITLADHIVAADDDYVSFADNGFFRY
ncbi:MAG: DNA repair protein RadC [Oscillospiraceae bacterium]|jgi:DNA repair protein RadC|nr:DNA repair protein RadC [Oscillospiraceae bacterium]